MTDADLPTRTRSFPPIYSISRIALRPGAQTVRCGLCCIVAWAGEFGR